LLARNIALFEQGNGKPALGQLQGRHHANNATADNGNFPLRRDYPLKQEDDRVWDIDEVDALLAKDLKRFESGVARYCSVDPDRQGQFDALVSFAFNVGLGNLQRSTLRMKHNRGDYWGAASEFMKWTKAAGKVLPGLVSRRQDEARMYLSP
jgi:hypothetical protein